MENYQKRLDVNQFIVTILDIRVKNIINLMIFKWSFQIIVNKD